jgi:hypothetical protein
MEEAMEERLPVALLAPLDADLPEEHGHKETNVPVCKVR